MRMSLLWKTQDLIASQAQQLSVFYAGRLRCFASFNANGGLDQNVKRRCERSVSRDVVK